MLTILCLLGCPGTEPEATPEPTPDPAPLAAPKHVVLFGAVPEEAYGESPPSEPLIDLGRMLYFDERLSGSGEVSCNSCHDLSRYGTTGAATSGEPGEQGAARNAPSTYNAILQFKQYWDGRVEDLEAQARAALLSPAELGMASESDVIKAIKAVEGYRPAFEAAFPDQRDPVTVRNVARALVAFQGGLTTPGSKLDRYLSGESGVLSEEEIEGFDRFVSTGCVSCHSGALIGGAMFQRLGSVYPYETEDEGRAGQSGADVEKRIFKVPSLRNVTKTGPWLHDGSLDSLEEVVGRMAHHQLGRELSPDEIASIILFLETAVGYPSSDYIEAPTLP